VINRRGNWGYAQIDALVNDLASARMSHPLLDTAG
jgi:hypothetical protein